MLTRPVFTLRLSSSKPFGSSSWLATMVLTRRFSLPGSTEPHGKACSPRTRQNPGFMTRFVGGRGSPRPYTYRGGGASYPQLRRITFSTHSGESEQEGWGSKQPRSIPAVLRIKAERVKNLDIALVLWVDCLLWKKQNRPALRT